MKKVLLSLCVGGALLLSSCGGASDCESVASKLKTLTKVGVEYSTDKTGKCKEYKEALEAYINAVKGCSSSAGVATTSYENILKGLSCK